MDTECIKLADLARIDERLKTHEKNIEDLYNIYQVVQKLTENMAVLTETTKNLATSIGSVKKDVEELKSQPGKEAKQYKFILVGAVMGSVVSALFAIIFQGGI
jgi:tetrahydromethanopterin S-methyltransferase subunit B